MKKRDLYYFVLQRINIDPHIKNREVARVIRGKWTFEELLDKYKVSHSDKQAILKEVENYRKEKQL